jgi:hypothetical protein
MFREVLYTQWKWSRVELACLCVAAFVGPTLLMRLNVDLSYGLIAYGALNESLGYTAVLFAGLAVLCGLGLAWRPYIVDAEARHVGPLTLPLPWRAFAALRLGAGATLLLAPALATWLGSWIVVAQLELPRELHAYPGGIALRFLAASLMAYVFAFLWQYVAGRRAVRIAVSALILIGLAEITAGLLHYPSPIGAAWDFLDQPAGPLAIFNSQWMLIDV